MLKRLLFIICCIMPSVHALSCTSAIIGAKANPYGRPLLWKHRDTGNADNVVEFINAGKRGHSYVALFNASDSLRKEAWAGFNDAGFAIMNTASYNLKNDTVPYKEMDKEGLVMTKALLQCVTVDDFRNLLEALPKPLGVEANFGVIDAWGNGAYFETDNFAFKRFDLDKAENSILIRTNYSHSGRSNEGSGFIREQNAIRLLSPYAETRSLTPEILTETASRSFYHSLMGKDFTEEHNRWVVDQDFIPRYTSTATIVIEGCAPLKHGEKSNRSQIVKEYIMWTGLGYPPCSEITGVRCSPEGVPNFLKGIGENGRSPQCDKVKARRSEVFPITKGSGPKYIDMNRLFNDENNGYLQILKPLNLETYKRERVKRDGHE